MTPPFSIQNLQEIGFAAPRQLRALASDAWIPSRSGVYAVLLDPPDAKFLPRSVGGHFKRLDPTVLLATLHAKWVAGMPTMYIGRADDLQKRIRSCSPDMAVVSPWRIVGAATYGNSSS